MINNNGRIKENALPALAEKEIEHLILSPRWNGDERSNEEKTSRRKQTLQCGTIETRRELPDRHEFVKFDKITGCAYGTFWRSVADRAANQA